MSKKLTLRWDKLQARSSIILLVVAAVIIEVMSVGQYLFTRNGIRHEVEQRARTEINLKNMEIQFVLSSMVLLWNFVEVHMYKLQEKLVLLELSRSLLSLQVFVVSKRFLLLRLKNFCMLRKIC